MIWLIILLAILSFITWLLISPLIIEVDTRIPGAGLRWLGIGKAFVWYENEWWLSFRIFFYRKTIRFSEIKSSSKKLNDTETKKKVKKSRSTRGTLKKLLRVISTIRVTKWELAIDTGDNVRNAQFYPLNYLPLASGHLKINFINQSYFVISMKDRPWRILYAFIR